jgi:hypothetical protein
MSKPLLSDDPRHRHRWALSVKWDAALRENRWTGDYHCLRCPVHRELSASEWASAKAIAAAFRVGAEARGEQRGRDQWLHATAHGARQWEGLLAKYDLAEDADANTVSAAAHARGVAEERARWEAGLTRKSESWHEKYHGLLRVTWAQCKTYTCMKDRSILAAMAPTSPSDAPGAAEGDGTA